MNVEKYFEFEDPDFFEDLEEYETEKNIDLFFDFHESEEADEKLSHLLKPPSSEQIQSCIETSGLKLKSIISHAKKKKPIKLLLGDFRKRDDITEEQFQKDISRATLNIFIENYPEKLLQVLDSDLEKVMGKIFKDFEGRSCPAADEYFSWHKICLNIKFLENSEMGFEMFKSFSKLSDKYDEKECKDLWDHSKPSFGSIGIIISTVYGKKKKEKPILDQKSLLRKLNK